MEIKSGTTGKIVGTVNYMGFVITRDKELASIMKEVDANGYVTIPTVPEEVDGTIKEGIEKVTKGTEGYLEALKIYLLREGFEVQGE